MYKPFPNDTRIGVSPEGILFNYRTCKILKQHKNKQGYMNVVLTSPGIKHRAYRVHRIYAITYIKRPPHLQHIPFKKLEVNHIDGNKVNNKKNNLEWVTGSGNTKHAMENGLRTTHMPVQVLNILTGEIIKIISITQTAEKFGIPLPTLAKHLKSKMAGRLVYQNYAFRFAAADAWPQIELRKRSWLITVAVNKITGEAHTFDKMIDVANFTGLNYATIHKALIVKQKQKWENDNWIVMLNT